MLDFYENFTKRVIFMTDYGMLIAEKAESLI